MENTMNILHRLAKLANELDKKGLYDEASILDGIISEAREPMYQAAPPGFRGTFYQDPMGYSDTPAGPPIDFSAQHDAMQARKVRRIKRRFRILNQVREEAGLRRKPIPSDKDLKFWATLPKGDPKREQLSPYDSILAQKLQSEYAGVLQSGQSPASLLMAIRKHNASGFDFAGKDVGETVPRGMMEVGPDDTGIASKTDQAQQVPPGSVPRGGPHG